MTPMKRYLPVIIGLAAAALANAQPKKSSALLDAMKTEMARSMEHFRKQQMPPYFLSYEITETESAGAVGNFGALLSSNRGARRRMLSIDLRVGDFKLDNTHPIRGAAPIFMDNFSSYPMPIDDDPDAIRSLLWYYTDLRYKRAVEQLISVRTNVKVKAEETDKSGDFSPVKPETYSESAAKALGVDLAVWEDKVRQYSAPFQRYGNIYTARAQFSANRESRWFVSSDGASLETADNTYRITLSAFAKASDGMELPRFEAFYSSSLSGLAD